MEEFIMNTKIYMGKACLSRLSGLEIKKAYIICDPFMEKSGKAAEIAGLLKETGADSRIFSKVVPDPTIQVVTQGIEEMGAFEPDTVIALGGGSAIDTAKAVCHLYAAMKQEKRPYLAAVPTTSGTGSEVTSFAVISDPQAQAKYPLRDPAMVPNAAFLDPELTATVPPQITADTGMDVLTHALEAYVSTRSGDFTDACAEKAVRMVWKYLEQAVADGGNMEAREHMHNASCLAGVAFNGASLGICHSLAHALGVRFHIPHGRSNAILLPHVIAYNAGLEEAGETEALLRYAQIANMLGISAGTEKATVHCLIRQIRNLMKRIGIPEQVTELGVEREEFGQWVEDMAGKALQDNCTATNPRKPELKELEDIYGRLCKGGLG